MNTIQLHKNKERALYEDIEPGQCFRFTFEGNEQWVYMKTQIRGDRGGLISVSTDNAAPIQPEDRCVVYPVWSQIEWCWQIVHDGL